MKREVFGPSNLGNICIVNNIIHYIFSMLLKNTGSEQVFLIFF